SLRGIQEFEEFDGQGKGETRLLQSEIWCGFACMGSPSTRSQIIVLKERVGQHPNIVGVQEVLLGGLAGSIVGPDENGGLDYQARLEEFRRRRLTGLTG